MTSDLSSRSQEAQDRVSQCRPAGADVTGTCMFTRLSGVHDRTVFKFHKLFLEGEWKCMYSEKTVDGEAAAEVQRFTPALSVRF